MHKSSETSSKSIRVTSKTFPGDKLAELLKTPGVFFSCEHILYPVSEGDRKGNHLDSLFIIEPIVANEKYVDLIVEDICHWISQENLQIDVIFAPAQPAVQKLVDSLAKKINKRTAYWEYHPTGWFGTKLVYGKLNPGDKVLVFNGVSQQGRCVGERLPTFVQQLGGQTVAAAVFAKGTADGVKDAEVRYGSTLYSVIQVDISVYSPSNCQLCNEPSPKPLVPWTYFRDQK